MSHTHETEVKKLRVTPILFFNPHLRTSLSLLLERENIQREREGGERRCAREKETQTEGNIDWLPPYTPYQGPNSQPRHVPPPGIEPATFWCMGRRSNQLSHTSLGRGPSSFSVKLSICLERGSSRSSPGSHGCLAGSLDIGIPGGATLGPWA